MYYKLAQLTLGVLLKIIFRPWAVGARNVPRQGAVILASNREPLDFSRFYGQASDHRVLRAIGELSGQEYVDMYAQQAKEKLAAGAPHPEASSPLPGTAPAPPGTLAGTPPETRS